MMSTTRFTQRLKDLIESGYGLDDSTVASEPTAVEGASTQTGRPHVLACHESRTQEPSRCFPCLLMELRDEPHALKEVYNEYS